MVRPDQPAIPADDERRSDAEAQADVALAAHAMRQPFHRRAGVLQSRPSLRFSGPHAHTEAYALLARQAAAGPGGQGETGFGISISCGLPTI